MKIKDTHYIRKCRSCRYFVEYANDKYVGWCHRNAPLPTFRGIKPKNEYERISEPPTVIACGWCGQYEPFRRRKGKQ